MTLGSPMMTTHIALLRGINLGSHNRIAMGDLRALLAQLGHRDARTLAQSGNIVLGAEVSPDELARKLESEIAGKLGVQSPVIVRTREELAAVVALDPLRELVDRDKLYQVSFLSAEPDRVTMQGIAAIDIAPERFVHSGREIYAWHPEGIQRSPLARMLSDKRLGVTATARNWNTVAKLLELAGELEG
jgi:uncharacterized protein (DUF1697 family)